ncbi:HET domain protein [Calycina marina]|uniref:HET domain protein n=1 Tax=Calycina marina TaxID=1763456 RepID=A0A9P7Z8X8_9HELO|nr:HET domain protein [Calycina marina]
MAERQSQVRMMGAVYSKATKVLCWLGPLDERKENAESKAISTIQFLRDFNRSPHFIWGKQEFWLDWTKIATFCRFMDDNSASVINYFGMKSWVANHINHVWETDSTGTAVCTSFVEVLHWARIHHSTDPRDYIYALLSHPRAKVDGSLLIDPNYAITAAQTYTEFALNMIDRTNSLQLLAFVDHPEEPSKLGLPTWVPDWHALNPVAPLRYPTKAAAVIDTYISFNKVGEVKVLKCRGCVIDTVQCISEMIVPRDLTVTTLEKEMLKGIPFLIYHIWDTVVLRDGSPCISLVGFVKSLSLVLSGGYPNVSDSTSGATQEQQKFDFAAFVLDTGISRKDRDLLETMAARGSAQQFIQDMTGTSMCRKVLGTAKGNHIGLGPRIMREGDVCAVIIGAAYPMVLRRYASLYPLVGPALLYGFMNGEAEKLCQNRVIFEQVIEIV